MNGPFIVWQRARGQRLPEPLADRSPMGLTNSNKGSKNCRYQGVQWSGEHFNDRCLRRHRTGTAILDLVAFGGARCPPAGEFGAAARAPVPGRFSGLYFAASTVTDARYRRLFFEPVLEDVKISLAARDIYLVHWADVRLAETVTLEAEDIP